MQSLLMYTYALQLLAFAAGTPKVPQHACKPIPGDPHWPSPRGWSLLNFSLQGRLITPSPPGAVCHPTQPTFDPAACASVASQWPYNTFHASNPVSNMLNNWNNDTCLPMPMVKCSGEGYPRYVINATKVEDIKRGVEFARRTGVRLIVKATGHDYLGR
jgi:hypothetical protein